jgi:phosphatidylglycerol:prolipoprotein diacylglycerol transferase
LSLPVHPTQLYNAGAALLVLGLLLVYARRPRRPGELMGVLMIVYPLTRWPIEAIRSDEPSVFLGMSWSQNMSVLLLLAGLGTWSLARRGRIDRSGTASVHGNAPQIGPSSSPAASNRA